MRAVAADTFARRNRAMLALGVALRREGWFPLQALREAIETSQRKEIARANVAAFEASAHLQSITNYGIMNMTSTDISI